MGRGTVMHQIFSIAYKTTKYFRFEEEVSAISAILGELCVAPHMGAGAFPGELNYHVTDSRLFVGLFEVKILYRKPNEH